MAAWMLHAACVREKAGARNLVFFRVMWLQPAWKVYLLCGGGAAAVVSSAIGSSSVFCNEWLFMCVCDSIRLLHLWLQIALNGLAKTAGAEPAVSVCVCDCVIVCV